MVSLTHFPSSPISGSSSNPMSCNGWGAGLCMKWASCTNMPCTYWKTSPRAMVFHRANSSGISSLSSRSNRLLTLCQSGQQQLPMAARIHLRSPIDVSDLSLRFRSLDRLARYVCVGVGSARQLRWCTPGTRPDVGSCSSQWDSFRFTSMSSCRLLGFQMRRRIATVPRVAQTAVMVATVAVLGVGV